jgi:hypothetical protein
MLMVIGAPGHGETIIERHGPAPYVVGRVTYGTWNVNEYPDFTAPDETELDRQHRQGLVVPVAVTSESGSSVGVDGHRRVRHVARARAATEEEIAPVKRRARLGVRVLFAWSCVEHDSTLVTAVGATAQRVPLARGFDEQKLYVDEQAGLTWMIDCGVIREHPLTAQRREIIEALRAEYGA